MFQKLLIKNISRNIQLQIPNEKITKYNEINSLLVKV